MVTVHSPLEGGGNKKILLLFLKVFFSLPPLGGVNGYQQMWRQLSSYLIPIFCSLLVATAWAENAPTEPFTQSQCLECHENKHPETVTDWQASAHAATHPNVDCVTCHGERHEGAIARSRKNTLCTTCHGGMDGAVVQSYRLSKHGIISTLEAKYWDWSLPLADGNYRAPTCAYCHLHAGNHAMGGEREISNPLRDPGLEAVEAALERRASPCYDCHSPRFARTWFIRGESMAAIGRMKAREATAVAKNIYPFGDYESSKRASTILDSMIGKHLRNVRLGIFHQSPDHQWWHGQPALDGDLLRLKGILSDLQRQK